MKYKHGEITQIYKRLKEKVKTNQTTVWRYIIDGYSEQEILEKLSKPRTDKYAPINWTKEKINTIKELYKNGESLSQISKTLGVGRSAVRDKLIQLGVYIRKW